MFAQMRSVLAALMLIACGDAAGVHTPNIADPTCLRSIVEAVTAGPDECVKLVAQNDRTEFSTDGEACGGVQCLLLQPGETGYVSTTLDRANHNRYHDACAKLACP